MGLVNRWDGSSMVNAPVNRWDGSNWVTAVVNKWDGSKWVNINSQAVTTTWDCTWTQAYQGDGTKRTDSRGNQLVQGMYDSSWGIHRSLIGFDNGSTIKSVLAGATIQDVSLYLHNEHWYYTTGGTVVLGYHNNSSEPTTFNSTVNDQKRQAFSARGQAQWIDMPNALGEGIRDGKYKGVSIYINSSVKDYYGIFSGYGDGSYKPKLKITYVK